MPPGVVALAALVSLLAAAHWVARRRRRQLLAELRARWGKPSVHAQRMDSIAEYHRSIVLANGAGRSLDDRTWNDLNLDEVFRAIDHTTSTIGQQALYHRLRQQDPDNRDAFEQLVERMSNDAAARERIQLALASLRDPNGYDIWWLAQADALTRPRAHLLFAVWAVVVLAALIAIPFWPGAILIPIVGAAVNLAIRTRTAWRVSAMIGPFRQVGALVSAAGMARDANLPGPIAGALAEALPKLTKLAAITRWVGRDPASSNDVVASFWEYMNLLFLLDVNALSLAAGQLRTAGSELLRVLASLGDIDAAISVASLRAGAQVWVRPQFQSRGPVTLAGLRHPLIVDAVADSIQLAPPHGVLITGSNMSGKSTFLRTVGVAAVMAQSINTCFCDDYRAPIWVVQSNIGRSDDLIAGKSYYLVEVEEVLARVQASASSVPHLFLFDELFRGTNAVERIAAGEAVLRALVGDNGDGKNHVVLAATHDAELVELLEGDFAACHFGDAIGPEGLTFDHRLAPGPATTRNAITLLELHGAPPALIQSALARASELDRQRRVSPRPG